MHPIWRHLRALCLAMILGVLTPSGAFAHAQLLSSMPATNAVLEVAPAVVELAFNEPVTAFAVTLIGPDGSRADLLERTTSGQTLVVALPADLGQGTHVLSYRVVSLDSHPVPGTLVFSVGAASGEPAAAGVAGDRLVGSALWLTRTLLYLALFFGVGGAVFGALTSVPDAARRLSVALAVAGLGLVPLHLGLHGLDVIGSDIAGLFEPRPWTAALATSLAPSSWLWLAAFALAILAWLRLPVLAWVALALAALALALSGHAGAAAPQWLTRISVFLHGVGLLFWLGALPPLLLHLARPGPGTAVALAAFSRFIPWAIAPLILSGLVLAVVQLGLPGPAWISAYGLILAAKLGLMVLLFGLALWNRLVLTAPALAGHMESRRRLALSIRAELVIVLLVLGLVAGWRFTPPPRALAERPIIADSAPLLLHLMTGNDMAMATLFPPRPGPVTLDIALSDAEGVPVSAQAVTAHLSSSKLGIEPITLPATDLGGAWRVENLQVPLSGDWRLELEIRKSRFELVRLFAEFQLP